MPAAALNRYSANPDTARRTYAGRPVGVTYGPRGLAVVLIAASVPGSWLFALPSRPFWGLVLRRCPSQHAACTLAVRYASRFC